MSPRAQAQHPELPSEQRYIDYAFDCLKHGEDDARRLAERDAGADKVTAAYLADMGRDLLRRRRDAEDRVCFARMDSKKHDGPLYIGRQVVVDRSAPGNKLVVISWHTPAAAAYYEATTDDAMGLLR